MGSTSSPQGANPAFPIQKHGYNLLLPCRIFLRNPSTKHYGKTPPKRLPSWNWALEESPKQKTTKQWVCGQVLHVTDGNPTSNLAFPNQVLKLPLTQEIRQIWCFVVSLSHEPVFWQLVFFKEGSFFELHLPMLMGKGWTQTYTWQWRFTKSYKYIADTSTITKQKFHSL